MTEEEFIKGFQSASDRRVHELVAENDTLKEQLGEEPREKKSHFLFNNNTAFCRK